MSVASTYKLEVFTDNSKAHVRRNSDEPRRNKRIRVPEVRLIGSEGEQLGIFATYEAIRRAEDAGLDLVEVSPTARPPVCKIMDYGKYKYEQSKKKHEAKKNQVVIKTKEIKMRPATDEHDFQTKLRHARKFLEHGDKVKFTIRFRGREMAHQYIARERMGQVVKELEGLGEVIQAPTMEGRQMFMVLSSKRKKKPQELLTQESRIQGDGHAKDENEEGRR